MSARVLRSEWTKLRSLPSTVWSLLATVVLIVGVGALYAMLRVARPPRELAEFDPTAISLAGVHLAQFAIGVLGVLLMTSEYSTGSIRASLVAVPRRLPVLVSKAVVLALAALALCVSAAFAAFGVGQSILAEEHLDTTLSQSGTARAVLGSALYLVAVGLLGLGLGGLLRSTGGAVAALFGLLFAPQILVALLPEAWQDELYRYLPAPAGLAVTAARPDPSSLGPWSGLALFCLYAAVVLAAAAWQLRRRDA